MLSNKVIKNEDTLRALSNARKAVRNTYLETAKKEIIDALVECAEKILSGVIKLSDSQFKSLKRYTTEIRALVKSAPTGTKRKLLQTGGFLGLLLKPVLGLLGGLLGPVLGGGQRR